MKTKVGFMKSHKITELNDAVFVIKHFVMLSAKLLPFLDELSQIKNPTFNEQLDKEKIINVYKSNKFDTMTSEVLLNSAILQKINQAFQAIMNNEPRENRLDEFLNEYNKLKQNWKYIESN